jgi:L-seryl-tRNA(Ser) seleniumtransferase
MTRAGCKLREVGTTNRTHLHDYAGAIGARTALIMKVHTSNFAVHGFTSAVDARRLGELSQTHRVPLAVDLGSGTLVDLTRWGLPAEPTPQSALAHGANLVSFSGDKLLGGPQAGLLVGDAALIQRIKRNPIRRALRVDKLRIAALEAVLKLYLNPELLRDRLPILRLMTRPLADLEGVAQALLPMLRLKLAGIATVALRPGECQMGSGSLPEHSLPSICIALTPIEARKGSALMRIARAFRELPVPVIGRIEKDAFCLDVRCLEDSEAFVRQLPEWTLG